MQGHDGRKSPAFYDAIALKGKVVESADVEVVAGIEIGQTPITPRIGAVLYDHALEVA